MQKKGPLQIKSYDFAIEIVQTYKNISERKKEFVLSKQLLRAGTAIGALIREAEFSQSPADFINKMSVALKEANETIYWINILKDTEYLTQTEFDKLNAEIIQLISMLAASVKTVKAKK